MIKSNLYTGHINGPYLRKDGRKHICIDNNGKRTTVSYPKFLVEHHIGRKLMGNETIDHIDQDFTNDELSNLRIVDRLTHVLQDAERLMVGFICPVCDKDVIREGEKAHWVLTERKRGKAGPYCSKSCTGKGGSKFTAELVIERFNTKLVKESELVLK